MSAGHVRVRVSGESFWAIRRPDLGPDVVQIDNVLLDDRYGFKDVVRIDDERNVVELIEKTLSQIGLEYDMPAETATFGTTWRSWHEALEAAGVFLEGLAAGVCAAAYPKGWSPEEALDKIRAAVPELRRFGGEAGGA